MITVVVPVVMRPVDGVVGIGGRIGSGQVGMAEGDCLATGAADGYGGEGDGLYQIMGGCGDLVVLRTIGVSVIHLPSIVHDTDGGFAAPIWLSCINISIGGV